jgi:hypothetical protein
METGDKQIRRKDATKGKPKSSIITTEEKESEPKEKG